MKILGSSLVFLSAIISVLANAASDVSNVEVQLTGKSETLAGFVVYLESEHTSSLPTTDKVVEISQQNKSFSPYISVMQLGNKVNFTNQDDITHHIYSPIGKNKFEMKIRSGKNEVKTDFVEAGEVAMGCNIHDWMSGYLLILQTPFFDKTNIKGHTEIKQVPTGKYQLTVWHPQLKTAEHKLIKQIKLTANAKFEFDVTDLMKKIPEQKSNDDFDFLDDY